MYSEGNDRPDEKKLDSEQEDDLEDMIGPLDEDEPSGNSVWLPPEFWQKAIKDSAIIIARDSYDALYLTSEDCPAITVGDPYGYDDEWLGKVEHMGCVYILATPTDVEDGYVNKLKESLIDSDFENTIRLIRLPADRESIEEYGAADIKELLDQATLLIGDPDALVVSLNEFMLGSCEVKWIIEDLLPAQSLAILSAKPKVGKTLLTFNLAISLARGDDFLGRKTKRGNILLIQLEDSGVMMRNRLAKMGVETLEGVFVWNGHSIGKSAWRELRSLIRANNINLVIVDPLVFAMQCNEQDATETARFLKKLRNIIFDTEASILLVHHHRKSSGEAGDQIRGSSAILGAVDVSIEIYIDNARPEQATAKIVSRYGKVPDEVLSLDPNTLWWQSLGKKDDFTQNLHKQQILESLKTDEAKSITDLEDALGVKKAAFHKALQDLIKEEKVRVTQEGTGGRPKKLYWLVVMELELKAEPDDNQGA